MTQIFVNDDLLDLYPNTVVALTVQKIDVAAISRRSLSFTNSIRCPWTNTNRLIFGYADNEMSDTSIPYTSLNCKIVQNGVEIIASAKIIISSSESDSFNIVIYENLIDLIDSIRNKVISDINPIASSSWLAPAIDTNRLNTSGIVSVILNWGKSGTIYQYDYFLPCFYYHTFITSILESTGLTLSGAILTDSDFLKLVIPYPGEKFKYTQPYVAPYAAKGSNSAAINLTQVLSGTRLITFDTIDYGTKLDAGTELYTFDGAVNCTVTAVIRVNAITWRSATYIKVQIYKNGSEVALYQINNPASDSFLQTITYNGDFVSGDVVKMNIQTDVGSVPNGADCTIVSGWTFTFTPTTDVPRVLVDWNELWPKVKVMDLIQDFFNRFGIVPKQEDGVLYLKTIEEILLDRSGSLDWSDKLVNKENYTISFATEYAQQNNFLYTKAEEVSDALAGAGSIDIANTNLQLSKDIFVSVFQNSISEFISYASDDVMTVTIPVYDSTSTAIDEFVNKPGLKLITIRDYGDGTNFGIVTFDVTNRIDYFIAYFLDDSRAKDTGFQYFIDSYYNNFGLSLQKNKLVSKRFLLTDSDISSYDPHKMIWDGNSYYIVNKITNYVSGRISNVELFKVS